jgi:hypothetical protein
MLHVPYLPRQVYSPKRSSSGDLFISPSRAGVLLARPTCGPISLARYSVDQRSLIEKWASVKRVISEGKNHSRQPNRVFGFAFFVSNALCHTVGDWEPFFALCQ